MAQQSQEYGYQTSADGGSDVSSNLNQHFDMSLLSSQAGNEYPPTLDFGLCLYPRRVQSDPSQGTFPQDQGVHGFEYQQLPQIQLQPQPYVRQQHPPRRYSNEQSNSSSRSPYSRPTGQPPMVSSPLASKSKKNSPAPASQYPNPSLPSYSGSSSLAVPGFSYYANSTVPGSESSSAPPISAPPNSPYSHDIHPQNSEFFHELFGHNSDSSGQLSSHSIATSTSKQAINEKQERERRVHRDAEKQRRESLRIGFEKLKDLLPASTIGSDKNWSQTRLLETGLEYIAELKRSAEAGKRENEMLKQALRKVIEAQQNDKEPEHGSTGGGAGSHASSSK
ncbi:hypothetical protein BDR26DRAFT_869588 [Obelidium mucronatum]|nr:hypothetical protein BDR26DRAFT_869588 [Obelidium mucronatum]